MITNSISRIVLITFPVISGMDGCVIVVSAVVVSVVVTISRTELVTIPGVVLIPGFILSTDVIGYRNVTFPGTYNGFDGSLIVVSAVVVSVIFTIWRIELVMIQGVVFK